MGEGRRRENGSQGGEGADMANPGDQAVTEDGSEHQTQEIERHDESDDPGRQLRCRQAQAQKRAQHAVPQVQHAHAREQRPHGEDDTAHGSVMLPRLRHVPVTGSAHVRSGGLLSREALVDMRPLTCAPAVPRLDTAESYGAPDPMSEGRRRGPSPPVVSGGIWARRRSRPDVAGGADFHGQGSKPSLLGDFLGDFRHQTLYS